MNREREEGKRRDRRRKYRREEEERRECGTIFLLIERSGDAQFHRDIEFFQLVVSHQDS